MKSHNHSIIANPANEMGGRKQSLFQFFCYGIVSLRFVSLAMTVLLLAGCGKNQRSPGWSYFPDMVYSQAYETYSPNPNFEDGQTARKPVAGTIARGALPDNPVVDDAAFEQSYFLKRYYPETPEGYEAAGAGLKNPIAFSEQVLAEGKVTYEIYCMVCHGEKGDGKGSIVEFEDGRPGAFPIVPAYSERLKGLPEGKMFHSITYGKNMMGSYSAQVSAENRWKVIYYIQKLSAMGRFASENKTAAADSVSASANTNQTK